MPTYDGRSPFNIKALNKLPPLLEEITPGAGVLVAFTVNAYNHLADNIRISCNVQHVVVIADPEDPEGYDSSQEVIDIHPGVDSDNTTIDDEDGAIEDPVGDEDDNFFV